MIATEILELVRAGFTKEEILAMTQEETTSNVGTENGTSTTNETLEGTNNGTEKTEDETPKSPNNGTDVNAQLLALTKQVESLTKTQQAANRARTSVQISNESADDIFASMINPK